MRGTSDSPSTTLPDVYGSPHPILRDVWTLHHLAVNPALTGSHESAVETDGTSNGSNVAGTWTATTVQVKLHRRLLGEPELFSC